MLDVSLTRLHGWHLHKRSLTCFRHVPSGSDITDQLQNRCCHCCGHKHMQYDWIPPLSGQYSYAFVWHRSKFEHGEGLDRARRHRGHCEDSKQGKVLHRVSFILPWRYDVTSKRNFIQSLMQHGKNAFMCFFAETRRSSENDSQSCDVPGFLKLGWSFKQLPKVRGSVHLEVTEGILFLEPDC